MLRNEDISLMAYSVTASRKIYFLTRAFWKKVSYYMGELLALLERYEEARENIMSVSHKYLHN